MGTNQENGCNQPTEPTTKKIDMKENSAVNPEIKIGTTMKQNHTSMSSLIIWNISKALERKPYMDLKSGMRMAQERLQRVSREGNTTISQYPEEEHLVCALLAWQQLGHARADSLYDFIMSKKIGEVNNNNSNEKKLLNTLIVTSNSFNIHCKESSSLKDVDALSFEGYSNGPVVKLPLETKIIMRMDQTTREPKKCTKCKRQASQESKNSTNSQGSTDTMNVTSQGQGSKCQKCMQRQASQESGATTNKINAACCMESKCGEKLAKMDADTAELRSRAEKLAKREAQRSELLERAEAAWKDLERGYQRRLSLAQEKEEDITRQIQKIIDDRNDFKNACNKLAQELKSRGDAAEEARTMLKTVEAEVCQFACQRLKLSEEATKAEAALSEQQCKTVQLQRDLQFKEEQLRRKVMTMESETESACALTHETERALRAELSGLREQITQVSNQLLEEDDINKRLKCELEELRQEKMGMIEDLDGCKMQCDNKIKGQLDELQAKRKQLQELKEKELECRCQRPVDAAVEVKRTPSLAALCKCAPEDRIMDSCSCTSMKGRLLSNLLADLFGGLQSELGGTGSQMPCQLLKCLEDQHNWDRASVTKSNLRNYFSKLLVGELDIAIATSIENYHAKWVGTTCADENIRMMPGPKDDLKEGWEKRAIEREAQKLAAQLAEELYEKRAEELTKRAKTIVTSGPPPCECNKRNSHHVYSCILESTSPFHSKSPEVARKASQFDKALSPPPPSYWKRTHRDVTQLRLEIEDLKKESIKKEDLKLMEDKITKIVQKTVEPENENVANNENENFQMKYRKETKFVKYNNADDIMKNTTPIKPGVLKKKPLELNNLSKKSYLQDKPTKQSKKYNYHQTYAVNMCLCATQKPNKSIQNNQPNVEAKTFVKQKSSKNNQSFSSNVSQTKHISHPSSENDKLRSKDSIEPYCNSDCKCFHKMPSNTSIDKLLETLTKWKSDLGEESQNELTKNIKGISKTSLSKHSKSILKNKGPAGSKTHSILENEKKISEVDMHKRNGEVEKPNHSINFNEIVKTASEYMATVNLDKLNDCANNYTSTKDTNKEKFSQDFNMISRCSNPFNCIETTKDKDSCNSCNPHSCNSGHTQKPEPTDSHSQSKTNNIHTLNILTNPKSTRAINTEENKKESELRDKVSKSNCTQHHAKLFQNLDYYVKFLGVTLVDTNSNKVPKNIGNICHERLSLCKEEMSKSETPKSGCDPSKHFTQNIVIDSSNKQKKCECKAKFDEFKNFIISLFNDQVKNKIATQKDIALDSQNLAVPIDTPESCICCHTYQLDSSKDLEVNAFDLLEAHLKEKLKELKICSCKSSCISAEEEEKIYRTILKRVKQVISECANELKCSESRNLLDTSQGSWQRAYGLLREYLKMKIKRAQCLPLLNEDKDEVLPNILDKVCNLIENDFQRLKDMCRCEKKNKLLTKIKFTETPLSKLNLELPKSDLGTCDKNNNTFIFKTISQQMSPRAAIFTQNISSQVGSDVEMESKSCDALAKNIHIVNAVSTQNSINPLTQSMSSQVPLDLGMVTKSCYTTHKNEVKTVSKQILTDFIHLSLQNNTYSQVPIELGMETKSCDAMIKADNIVKIVSNANIAKYNMLSQHIGSQVPPNLGMESKFCEPMVNNIAIYTKTSMNNQKETSQKVSQICLHPKMKSPSSDVTGLDNDEIPPELIYNTCNCNYNRRSRSSHVDIESKTVLFNLHADVLLGSNIKNTKNFRKSLDWMQSNVLENAKSLPDLASIKQTKPLITFDNMEEKTNRFNNDSKIVGNFVESDIPYVGTTIDCICDSSFKSCTCTKSLIQDNCNKGTQDWKQLLYNGSKYIKKFSYIMNGTYNKNSDNNTCESEDIFLLHPKKTLEAVHHSTNTSENNTRFVDSLCDDSLNWFMSPQLVKSQTKTIIGKHSNVSFFYEPVDDSSSCKSATITELIPSTDKLANSLYYEPIITPTFSHESLITINTNSDSLKPSRNCNCDTVPLCHVKMLVENIERNIIESKCTCDSVSKICPMHSRGFR